MTQNNRIAINPELLIWARERAGVATAALVSRFPRLAEWETGVLQPTIKQLEDFAQAMHVPFGYLFLPVPPAEPLPVPDFRTHIDQAVTRPSANLLDTIYLCQVRQDWFREYARTYALEPVDFVQSGTISQDPVTVAEHMRQQLNVSVSDRQQNPTWIAALRQLIARAEDAGILVMVSSIVGNNSHRKLDVDEFRGFALVDHYAPLIFLNAADSKSAQMFTLAHELAHVWLGESGISDSDAGHLPADQSLEQSVEQWCNAVAAEFLMPLHATQDVFQFDAPLLDEVQRLAKLFKVSSLVVLRRLFDAGFLRKSEFWHFYQDEIARLGAIETSSGGGDFYRTLGSRTGKRFARAVLTSTLEGQTLFQDAFRMLGMRKSATFYEAAREMEVLV